jgi:hypothetical protein
VQTVSPTNVFASESTRGCLLSWRRLFSTTSHKRASKPAPLSSCTQQQATSIPSTPHTEHGRHHRNTAKLVGDATQSDILVVVTASTMDSFSLQNLSVGDSLYVDTSMHSDGGKLQPLNVLDEGGGTCRHDGLDSGLSNQADEANKTAGPFAQSNVLDPVALDTADGPSSTQKVTQVHGNEGAASSAISLLGLPSLFRSRSDGSGGMSRDAPSASTNDAKPKLRSSVSLPSPRCKSSVVTLAFDLSSLAASSRSNWRSALAAVAE